MIMDSTEKLPNIRSMVSEKMFNKLEPLDVLAYWNLHRILENQNLDRIVIDFWTGPYETKNFLRSATGFQILTTLCNDDITFMGYARSNRYRYSISRLWGEKPPVKKEFYNKHRKAHFFMYQLWKKSMRVRYTLEAVFLYLAALGLIYRAVIMVEKTPDFDYYEGQIANVNTELNLKELENQQLLANGLPLQDTSQYHQSINILTSDFNDANMIFIKLCDDLIN